MTITADDVTARAKALGITGTLSATNRATVYLGMTNEEDRDLINKRLNAEFEVLSLHALADREYMKDKGIDTSGIPHVA